MKKRGDLASTSLRERGIILAESPMRDSSSEGVSTKLKGGDGRESRIFATIQIINQNRL